MKYNYLFIFITLYSLNFSLDRYKNLFPANFKLDEYFIYSEETGMSIFYNRNKSNSISYFKNYYSYSNNTLKILTVNNLFSNEIYINNNLKILKKDTYYLDTNMINNIKLDREYFENNEDKLSIYYYYSGKLKKKEDFILDNKTFYIGIIDPYVRYLISQGIKGSFNNDIFLGNYIPTLNTLNASFKLSNINSNEILDILKRYDATQDIIDFIEKNKKNYYIFEMSLNGLLKTVYPHKFYWVFEDTPPYNYVLYFGGDPKNRVMTLIFERKK